MVYWPLLFAKLEWVEYHAALDDRPVRWETQSTDTPTKSSCTDTETAYRSTRA